MTQPQPFFAPVRSFPKTSSSSDLALLLLGPSTAMAQLWGQIRRLAPHVRTVLLTGEQNCGQEAMARLLLDLSTHAHRSFLQITAADAEHRLARPSSASSLPGDLFLFLPDVDTFSMEAQEGLLRLMRMRRSRPFTMVVSATEDLRSLVGLGRFSAELADALSSIRIAVPSLKQRTEDLPMLISQMLAEHAHKAGRPVPQVTEEFLHAAMRHLWPGNLGELSQTMAALVASSQAQELRAEDLERVFRLQPVPAKDVSDAARLVSLDTVVQEHICAVLRACRGNKVRAAEVLGISRSTLYRMLDTTTQHTPFQLAS